MDKEVLQSIDCFAEENAEGIFRDIARLVAIDSVQGESEENAPFGAGPTKALAEALSICSFPQEVPQRGCPYRPPPLECLY